MGKFKVLVPMSVLMIVAMSSCGAEKQETSIQKVIETKSTPATVITGTTMKSTEMSAPQNIDSGFSETKPEVDAPLRPLEEKSIITKSDAIARCKEDMKEPVMMSCQSVKDIVGIEEFLKALGQEGDHTQKVNDLITGENGSEGSYGVNYLGNNPFILLKIKYFEGGYMLLSHSPQYDDVSNVVLEYRKIYTDGQSVSVFYDDFSRWEVGEPDTPTPSKYYETLTKEFEKGIFSNPKLQKFYDNFVENVRKG